MSAFALLASPAAAIVNGTTAGGSSWPWAVQVLLISSGGEFEGLCGGTLVQPQRVVTSGDCTTSGADLFVIANSKKLFDESVPFIPVTDFERAPNWSSFSPNDVAILELADAPDPATPIAVLGAGESADFPNPASALVAGWGATNASSGDPSETLQQGQVSLEAGSGCGEPGILCSDMSTEPCFGDLGGPAIVQLGTDTVSKDPTPENGTWRLVALPLGGTSDCTQIVYVDLTQPGIRAFIEEPIGEPPVAGGGNPAPPLPPAPAPPSPPQTNLKKAQIDAGKGKASFRFKGSGNLSGFQCALASGKRKKPKFRTCRSPKTYKQLAPGTYVFKVRAVGPGGPDTTPAKKRFTIPSA